MAAAQPSEVEMQPDEPVQQPTVQVPQETSPLPHLESMDRIKKIPLVEAALSQSAGMYEKVKGYNPVFNWTLSTAESTMHKAMDQAMPIAAPLAKKLETPIHVMDQTFCKGLTIVEDKLPIMKQPPQQIYETARSYVMPAYNKMSAMKDYGFQKAKSLKELCWIKANEVLATRYGNIAYTGFGTAATMAESYLNSLFPPTEEELKEQTTVVPASSQPEEDRVLHMVHTVGRLSSTFGCRIYHVLSNQVRNLNKKTVGEYITSLIAAIQLTNYLNGSTQSKPVVTPKPTLETVMEEPEEKQTSASPTQAAISQQ